MRTRLRVASALAAGLLVVGVTSCSSGDEEPSGSARDDGPDPGDHGDCVVVDLAVSSEKATLVTELAREFNGSPAADLEGGGCAFARVQATTSSRAAELLATGWDEAAEGPRPVVWSPDDSSWGALADQWRQDEGRGPIVGEAGSLMWTPLVIAMPAPMAASLGHPEEAVGWADVVRLAQDPQGWAAYGHPEWGPFRLGKANPHVSPAGLSALVAQAHAAAGTTEGLSDEDLSIPAVAASARAVESAVVHYGDTALPFLQAWDRADAQGTSPTYLSAAAVEERAVIAYNRGDPGGEAEPGERPEPPRIPLVAIYPSEGTTSFDNPYIVLDAAWVTARERLAARAFEHFLTSPGSQREVLERGFRPGRPNVAVAAPVTADLGVDPDQPAALLEAPAPDVVEALLDRWDDQRKGARVTFLLDLSASMGEAAGLGGSETKLDLAKPAVVAALDQLADHHEVGLRTFTTGLGDGRAPVADVVPIAPIAENRERLRREVEAQIPRDGTPLYDALQATFDDALDAYDPNRINAVVLLSDGVNDDLDPSDDEEQLDALISHLRESTAGELAKPIRVFPVAYGARADTATLRRIADASRSTFYDAQDPATIDQVLAAVASNF